MAQLNRFSIVSLLALGLAMPAMAQGAETGPQPPTDEDDQGRDVVVITANKREETVQDVAVAVTALSADTKQELGVITVTDTRAFLKSAAGRGLADGSTLNWNTSSKVLEVKDGGLTGAKLDQTSFSYPGIFTSTKTGGGSSAAIYLNASAPGIAWNVGGATSNNKRWDLVGVSNTLVLRMLDDSNGTVGSAITFTRSASTLTGVAINGPTTMVGNSSEIGRAHV